MDPQVEATLRAAGKGPGDALPIARVALALAAVDRPLIPLDRYEEHLDLLAEDVARAASGAESIADCVEALNGVIFDAYGYHGDRRTYDDLQNANLMRVIDRRRGLPVALGILCIHAARAQGWSAVGLSFPNHFLLRIGHAGRRAILDPFERGAECDAADLRELLRQHGDDDAELELGHYEAASDRDVLLRLQNNIKLRQAQRGNLRAAVATIETMLLVAPENKSLWREKGMLDAQIGRIDHAVAALEEYIARETLDGPRHDAAILLQKLRGQSG